jgi:diguanylate cyclase (GGDEF)-like protein
MADSVLTRIRGLAPRRIPAPAPSHPRAGSPEAAESELAARALGWLYIAGGTIGTVSVLLPHAASTNIGGLWSNIAFAYLGAISLLVFAAHVRRWMIHVALVAGALLITRAILLSHEPESFYAIWYIWIGLYAFYFFARRAATAHILFAGLLYAYTLHHAHTSEAVARWLTTMATIVVASVFIDTLARRTRGQASAAETSANMMASVNAIAHRLAALDDSGEARVTLCDAIAVATGAVGVALWEPSDDGAKLIISAVHGRRPDRDELGLDTATAGAIRSFLTGRPVVSAPSDPGELASEFTGADNPGGLRWQPIVWERRSIAVLGLYWPDHRTAGSAAIATFAGLLASEAANTLERVGLVGRLESLARTDELTGLPNRRAWQEQLPRELDRADGTGDALCVAMLDLDHFKRFNDVEGHLAGDVLLKDVAVSWRGQLRPSDLLARYGGEEFAVALPGCSEDHALEVIERVRRATPAGQACSGGIAQWDGIESVAELLGRADRALYQAKQGGRNQIRLAERRAAALTRTPVR